MPSRLLRSSRFISPAPTASPFVSPQFQHYRNFSSTFTMATVVDSNFLSQITTAEKLITKQDNPVKGGPTVRAQSHVGSEVTSQVVHDITLRERAISSQDSPVQGGPTSVAQSILSQGPAAAGGAARSGTAQSRTASGILDSETISKITEKEKEITGSENPVRKGPTAEAQQHVGEPITSEALHDITEGEKKITGGERIKGGPTSAAQSELAKSRY